MSQTLDPPRVIYKAWRPRDKHDSSSPPESSPGDPPGGRCVSARNDVNETALRVRGLDVDVGLETFAARRASPDPCRPFAARPRRGGTGRGVARECMPNFFPQIPGTGRKPAMATPPLAVFWDSSVHEAFVDEHGKSPQLAAVLPWDDATCDVRVLSLIHI